NRPRARVERHDRAALAAERRDGRALGARVERRVDVVALLRPAAELVDQRLELVLLTGELAVVGLLDPGAPARDERVADGVREQPAPRVGAEVTERLALAHVPVQGEPRTVAREDQPARDALRLEERAAVERVVLEALRLEHGPARRE